MKLFEPVCLWPVGAELGEGALWHAATDSVYFVDIKGRQIYRCASDGGARHSWPAPQQVSFIVPLAGGGFACGLEDGIYRFDEAGGTFTLLRAVEADQPSNRFNDGFVDHQGCLWFGSMDNGEQQPTGALYRIGAAGQFEAVDRGYVITNGPAMSPDGSTLYHTDTLKKEVYAFDVQAGGGLANKRLFASFAGRAGHPDGMAVDADGNLWVALFGGARIDRFSRDGELTGSVPFPVPNITKLAFGGEDLRTAFVTTAWKGLTPGARAHAPLAGALFSFRTDTPGLAQQTFSTGQFA
jgi:sugar lactone lactonase YvrE